MTQSHPHIPQVTPKWPPSASKVATSSPHNCIKSLKSIGKISILRKHTKTFPKSPSCTQSNPKVIPKCPQRVQSGAKVTEKYHGSLPWRPGWRPQARLDFASGSNAVHIFAFSPTKPAPIRITPAIRRLYGQTYPKMTPKWCQSHLHMPKVAPK